MFPLPTRWNQKGRGLRARQREQQRSRLRFPCTVSSYRLSLCIGPHALPKMEDSSTTNALYRVPPYAHCSNPTRTSRAAQSAEMTNCVQQDGQRIPANVTRENRAEQLSPEPHRVRTPPRRLSPCGRSQSYLTLSVILRPLFFSTQSGVRISIGCSHRSISWMHTVQYLPSDVSIIGDMLNLHEIRGAGLSEGYVQAEGKDEGSSNCTVTDTPRARTDRIPYLLEVPRTVICISTIF